MSRKCYISGTGPKVINNVSHANNRTKRRQLPNLQVIRIYDEKSGTFRRRRVTARMIRTLDKQGALARAPRQHDMDDDEF
jgi:large subunit ribosomal protein L28